MAEEKIDTDIILHYKLNENIYQTMSCKYKTIKRKGFLNLLNETVIEMQNSQIKESTHLVFGLGLLYSEVYYCKPDVVTLIEIHNGEKYFENFKKDRLHIPCAGTLYKKIQKLLE